MSAAAGPAATGTWSRGLSSRMRRIGGCLAVMTVAAFLLFVRLDDVRAPIWDEAYYLPSTARFHEGRVQFATHPPLGLMLIAAGDLLYGGNRDIDQHPVAAVKSIPAEAMPLDYNYFGPRLAAATSGVIAAGLFFLLTCELTGRSGAGLMLSPLYLCNTAFLAQFRAAHLDSFQIAFALAAMFCLLRGIERPRAVWAASFGACVMAATLVRANAAMLAPLGLFLLWPLASRRQWWALARSLCLAVLAAVLTLGAVWACFVLASPRLPDSSTSAGTKDLAYISPGIFKAGRVDPHDPQQIVSLAGSYLNFMVSDNRAMAREDGNGSHPWQWLVGARSITYRWDAGEGRVATIAMASNLAVWLISLGGVLITLWSSRKGLTPAKAAMLAGWMLNMGALLWLDAGRVLYLYCYFLPLLFGHALAALAWRDSDLHEGVGRLGLAAVTLCFLVTAPLALHQRVSQDFCAAVLRDCGA